MRTIINFVAFQVGWFSCVLGAANGMPWIGLAVVAAVIALHLNMSESPRRELQLMGFALLLGMVLDSALLATGWISYPSGSWIPGFAPYWILAMWVLFATTINVSMSWLKNRMLVASVFGAIGGPLSYIAGQKLGGISLENTLQALTYLAVAWALAMPALLTFADREVKEPCLN